MYHKIYHIYVKNPNNKKVEWYSLEEFKFLRNTEWVFTEKVKGTNIRVIWNGSEITFAGRYEDSIIPIGLYTKLQNMFLPKVDLFKNQFGEGDDVFVCFYGEGYGNDIENGLQYSKDYNFVLFDVLIGKPGNRHWFTRKKCEYMSSMFDLDIVPIVLVGTLDDGINMVKQGLRSRWGDFIAEGLVGKPKVDLLDRLGNRIITKIAHSYFKEGEL